MKDFPHISDTKFPDLDTVAVYQYENDFDYKRWNERTKIKLMRVPWCNDYDHVVKFENDVKRNEWFDNQQTKTIELESNVVSLPDGFMRLPIPFDVLSKYNYIMIDFPVMTSPTDPISFESNDRKGRWFYFVSDVRSQGPNCSEALIDVDWWTTFINDTKINYLILERGHAPLAATNADTFLENPVVNNQYLLAPDVDFGGSFRIPSSDVHTFNNDNLACIATTGDIFGDWSGYKVPTAKISAVQGAPGAYVFACEVENLHELIKSMQDTRPHMLQTLKGIFFVSKGLVTIERKIKVCGVECYTIEAVQKKVASLDLNKELFKYSEKYANLAKLYTSPYAHLEFFDEEGNKTIIKIEDTGGTVDLWAGYNLLFPFISLDAYCTGIGNNHTSSIIFKNLSPHTFKYGGDWTALLKKWNIPIFEVYQSGADENKYAAHYTNEQALLANKNAYTMAVKSADTSVVNNEVQVKANVAMTRESSSAAFKDVDASNQINALLTKMSNNLARNTQSVEATAETQKTAVGAASNILSGAVSGGVSGAAVGGPAGIAGGAALGAINGIAGAVTSGVNTAISINLASSKVELVAANQDGSTSKTNETNVERTGISQTAVWNNMNTQNTASSTITLNNSTTAKENALLAKQTADAGVNASINQAATRAPFARGTCSNGANTNTRPMSYFVNVVTQSNSAIAQAGDVFLRYGYALNRQWKFDTFNVMKNFSYWKCSEVWCVGGVNDMMYEAENAIKSILINGTTVWSNPDKIGKVVLNDN